MKKLRRLSVCLLLAAILLAPVCASAQTYAASMESLQRRNDACMLSGDFKTQCGLEIVRQANARIEQVIEQSSRLAQCATSKAQIDAIIVSMLLRTSAISKTAQAAASLCGVKTVCEYVQVTLGGRTVYVDPLRVVLV